MVGPKLIRNSGKLELREDGGLWLSDWHVDCAGSDQPQAAMIDAIIAMLQAKRAEFVGMPQLTISLGGHVADVPPAVRWEGFNASVEPRLPPEYAWMAEEPNRRRWPWAVVIIAIALLGAFLGTIFFQWSNT